MTSMMDRLEQFALQAYRIAEAQRRMDAHHPLSPEGEQAAMEKAEALEEFDFDDLARLLRSVTGMSK